MPRIEKSPAAREDLAEIWLEIAVDQEEAADRLLDRIERRLVGLAENPLIGRIRDDLAKGLRSVPVGNYLLIYLPLPDGIVLVRVLHGARDLGRLFEE